MLSRVLVVLSGQCSTAVSEHEGDQIDGHPTFRFIRNHNLMKVFQDPFAKWLKEAEGKNHIQLLNHDGRKGNLSEQGIGYIFRLWEHINCIFTNDMLGGSCTTDCKPQPEEIAEQNLFLFGLLFVRKHQAGKASELVHLQPWSCIGVRMHTFLEEMHLCPPKRRPCIGKRGY